MKSLLRFLLLFFFFMQGVYGQQGLWSDIPESNISLKGEKIINPLAYRTVRLNTGSMLAFLGTVPEEFNQTRAGKPVVLELPMPDGTFQSFAIVKTDVMHPDLAVKYPEIQTYSGRGLTDPTATVRLDFTPHGFHAMILAPKGNVFIDPHNRGDIENYVVYYTRDFVKEGDTWNCNLLHSEDRQAELDYLKEMIAPPTGPQLRTYRLAVAATGEYTNFHGGTVTLGLAAIVTTVNRVVGVYEKEVAVRMVLVPNNDLLVYTNASTDPYSNSDGGAMLSQNQTTVDNVIGSANYDVGHVVSTGGGGVAYLGVICVGGWKARGVTGSYQPIGDPFDIDYVAHEMGHQFSGNHSFNGTRGSCGGGNRNASTAYEPGSGSTIMAYAGICSSDDLQPHSDPYFHTINFDEIVNYTQFGSGNGCAVITNTGNSAPVVTVPAGGFAIPKSTPFELTGSATDADGDVIVYSWEEFDLGPAGAPTAPSGNAPTFRAWSPKESPVRTFPRLSELLNNTAVKGEVLPSYGRNLTFRLVARDNKPAGGGVNYATIAFTVDANSGPFTVTSPNTNVSWPGGSTQQITWSVANTTAAPVNCASVNILLSVDGGQTYPFVLASGTPNDGSESVTIPENPVSTARIKVEAAGNIFFDISNVNFTIDQPIPVELISFTASVVKEGIKLEWKTATELNNAGFEIERSRDEENFETIGYRKGFGTSASFGLYNFIDESASYGTYFYRLKQTDFDGSYRYVSTVKIDAGAPRNFELEQNYPNPFNPSTKIGFTVAEEGMVTLAVYDILGSQVQLLVNENKKPGRYEVEFNPAGLTSGVYMYKMTTGSFVKTQKMILTK